MTEENNLEFSIEGDATKLTSALDNVLKVADEFVEKIKALSSVPFGQNIEDGAKSVQSAFKEIESSANSIEEAVKSGLDIDWNRIVSDNGGFVGALESQMQGLDIDWKQVMQPIPIEGDTSPFEATVEKLPDMVPPVEAEVSVNSTDLPAATEALKETKQQSEDTRTELGTPFVITAGDVIAQANAMSTAIEGIAESHAKVNESSARIGLLNNSAISESDIKSMALAYQNEDHSMQDVLAIEKKLALQKVDSKEKMQELIPVYQDWAESMGTTGADAMTKTTPMFKAFGVGLQDQQKYMEGVVRISQETSLGLDGLGTATQRVGYNFANAGMDINQFEGFLLAAKSKGLGDRQMYSLLNQGLSEINDNAEKAGTEVPKGTDAVKALADTLGWSVEDVNKFIDAQKNANGEIEKFGEAEKKGHTAFQSIETAIQKATYGVQDFVTPLEPAAAGVLGIATAGAQLSIFDKFLLDGKIATGLKGITSELPLIGTTAAESAGGVGVLEGSLAGLGPAGIIAAGAVAVGIGAYITNFGEFRDNVNQTVSDIESAISDINKGEFEKAGKDSAKAFSDGFETVADLTVKTVESLPDVLPSLDNFERGLADGARKGAQTFTQTLSSELIAGINSTSTSVVQEAEKIGSGIESAIRNFDYSQVGSGLVTALQNIDVSTIGSSLGSKLVNNIEEYIKQNPIESAIFGAAEGGYSSIKQNEIKKAGLTQTEANDLIKSNVMSLLGDNVIGNSLADALADNGNIVSKAAPGIVAPGASSNLYGGTVIDISKASQALSDADSLHQETAKQVTAISLLQEKYNISASNAQKMYDSSENVRAKYDALASAKNDEISASKESVSATKTASNKVKTYADTTSALSDEMLQSGDSFKVGSTEYKKTLENVNGSMQYVAEAQTASAELQRKQADLDAQTAEKNRKEQEASSKKLSDAQQKYADAIQKAKDDYAISVKYATDAKGVDSARTTYNKTIDTLTASAKREGVSLEGMNTSLNASAETIQSLTNTYKKTNESLKSDLNDLEQQKDKALKKNPLADTTSIDKKIAVINSQIKENENALNNATNSLQKNTEAQKTAVTTQTEDVKKSIEANSSSASSIQVSSAKAGSAFKELQNRETTLQLQYEMGAISRDQYIEGQKALSREYDVTLRNLESGQKRWSATEKDTSENWQRRVENLTNEYNAGLIPADSYVQKLKELADTWLGTGDAIITKAAEIKKSSDSLKGDVFSPSDTPGVLAKQKALSKDNLGGYSAEFFQNAIDSKMREIANQVIQYDGKENLGMLKADMEEQLRVWYKNYPGNYNANGQKMSDFEAGNAITPYLNYYTSDSYLNNSGRTADQASNRFSSLSQFLETTAKSTTDATNAQNSLNKAISDNKVTTDDVKSIWSSLNTSMGKNAPLTQQAASQTLDLSLAYGKIQSAQDLYTRYMSDGNLSTQEAADMQSKLVGVNKLLADAGITATGGISGLPPALQSLGQYAQDAVARINAAIASANSAISQASSIISQAQSAYNSISPSTGKSSGGGTTINNTISGNTFSKATTAGDLLSDMLRSSIAAGH